MKMKQFNYCYILVHSDSETLLLSFLCIFFSLLTSGKGLMDYKHQHNLAVEQRFSEDSCLSMRLKVSFQSGKPLIQRRALHTDRI